ncbi:MAG: NAD-dependent epimerase/dehydratase family protein, partial [Gammaproteobacteria bacterium]
MIEDIFRDMAASERLHPSRNPWKTALLRYFNPIGAHESGLIGEDPNGIPNNLLPYIAQVAVGRLQRLSVFGDDYPTPDGTGIRDYIHVVDLARGHLKALHALNGPSFVNGGCRAYNLGTGRGYSVLEMIRAFEQTVGRPIDFRVVSRRPGDVAECCADPSLALKELGWKAEKNLEDMVGDTWRWQKNNPDGYGV